MMREKALEAAGLLYKIETLLYKIETYEALADELACLSILEEINNAFGDHIEDEFLAIVKARIDKYTAELGAL